MTARMPAAVKAVWQSNRAEYLEQSRTLATATAAMVESRLDEELRAKAERDAHNLAGSLGMFGSDRGSELARELEHALLEPASADPSHLAGVALALGNEIEGLDSDHDGLATPRQAVTSSASSSA